MIEKQFIADNEYVMQNGQVYVVCGGEHSADVVATALNELINENEQLKERIKKLEEENKLKGDFRNFVNKDIVRIKKENKQLKKDRFICLDCKYCGYTEIGCLCEKQDHWEDFKSECNDFEELKY